MFFELGGSLVSFKTREKTTPLTPEQERSDHKQVYSIREGITILRKLRTAVLAEPEAVAQQRLLGISLGISQVMADFIYVGRRNPPINPENHPFTNMVRQLSEEYKNQDWETNHMGSFASIPQYSAQNLRNATDDMLIRTEEKVGSLDDPSHKLDQEEVLEVLSQFLLGTNDLHPVNTRDRIFSPNARHGGILSGGMVYLHLAQRILQDYAGPDLCFNPFVIAVDKASSRAVFQTSPTDGQTKLVYVLDDMIDKGGTVGTAWRCVGEHFTNADVWSGLGVDYALRRAEEAKRKLEAPLFSLFQDYCDLTDTGDMSGANTIFAQAERYAKEHQMELTPGWFIRKAKVEKRLNS